MQRNHSRFQKLEYGSGTVDSSSPSSPGFGVGGQSYSKFLASAVEQLLGLFYGLEAIIVRTFGVSKHASLHVYDNSSYSSNMGL